MWIALACSACFLIGGYGGLCLGYCAGREIIRNEIRELLDRAWPIADGEQSGNHADEAGVIR